MNYKCDKSLFMKRKSTYFICSVILIAISGVAGIQFSGAPPTGLTGATGSNCTNCHGGTVNSGGGNVSVTGLPATLFTPGQAYDFSLTISHGAADRKRWGFSIAAINSVGQNVGTFSSTNPSAAPNGSELSHLGAVTTGSQSSFTYNNLKWTAPLSPGPNDNTVRFFYVGNAANGSSSSGDFIYTGNTQIILPITLESFNASVKGNAVMLYWKTSSENNSDFFEIEKSADQLSFIKVNRVSAAGNSNEIRTYNYADDKAVFFDKPVYYRIVLVDKDGTRKYSKVISAIVKSTNTFVKSVYPNGLKAGNNLFANIVSDREQIITIELISFTGSRIKQIQRALLAGENTVHIPVNKFTAQGLYSLVVRTESGTQQIPVLIQP